jgi:trimeric autotransporter adhesin
MKRHAGFVLVGFLLLALSMAAQTAGSNPASAQVPPLIQFSSVATDEGGNTLSGVVSLTFTLYATQQGGEPLWMETQNNLQLDPTGHYSVQLGITKRNGMPTTLFTTGEARWLGVRIAEQAEQPRVLLLSVPYALKAGDAATIGGLPPSAFVLAAPGTDSSEATVFAGSTAPPADVPPAGSVTGSGTADYIPLWTTTSNIGNSVLFQSGTGSTAKVGINTITPASTLDVKGAATIRGLLSLPAAGTATATKGYNSQAEKLTASAFNSSTGTAVTQNFQWQAEPVGNDSSTAGGALHLLFGQGINKLAETGLNVASDGQITFASGQSFPGTGDGTVTSVGSGAGLAGGPITGSGTLSIATSGVTNAMLVNPSLTVTASSPLSGGGSVSLGGTTSLGLKSCATNQILQFVSGAWACANAATGTVTSVGSGAGLAGGPITGSGTLSIATGGVSNAMLANSSLTVTAGAGLTGGGSVSLGGSTSLSVDTTKVPLLATANTFTGTQTVNGNLSATGMVTGSGFQIGSNLFAFGSYANENAFLGFAGNANAANTGIENTASGPFALVSNTTGNYNAAIGVAALAANTTGTRNTASGFVALIANTTGNYNTANGADALYFNTGDSSGNGSYNTASGFSTLYYNTTGNFNTASGSNALLYNTTGGSNTASGYNAGATADDKPLTGSNNTAVGAYTTFGLDSITNATAIGANAEVTNSNTMVLGSINGTNGATADTFVGIGTTTPLAKLNVNGVESTQNGLGAAITISNSASGGGHFYLRTGATGTKTPADGFSIGNDNVYAMTITSGGAVGILTLTPTNIFTIAAGTGSAIADGWSTYSSRRWKTNIQTLHGALGKVEQLRGVSYDLKANGKHEVGVIAEEVGAVVPEVVSYEANGKDARGVDYSRLTALLIEATKEQQQEFRHQQTELAKALRQIRQQQSLLRAQSSAMRSLAAEVHEARETLLKVKAQVTAAEPMLVAAK